MADSIINSPFLYKYQKPTVSSILSLNGFWDGKNIVTGGGTYAGVENPLVDTPEPKPVETSEQRLAKERAAAAERRTIDEKSKKEKEDADRLKKQTDTSGIKEKRAKKEQEILDDNRIKKIEDSNSLKELENLYIGLRGSKEGVSPDVLNSYNKKKKLFDDKNKEDLLAKAEREGRLKEEKRDRQQREENRKSVKGKTESSEDENDVQKEDIDTFIEQVKEERKKEKNDNESSSITDRIKEKIESINKEPISPSLSEEARKRVEKERAESSKTLEKNLLNIELSELKEIKTLKERKKEIIDNQIKLTNKDIIKNENLERLSDLKNVAAKEMYDSSSSVLKGRDSCPSGFYDAINDNIGFA